MPTHRTAVPTNPAAEPANRAAVPANRATEDAAAVMGAILVTGAYAALLIGCALIVARVLEVFWNDLLRQVIDAPHLELGVARVVVAIAIVVVGLRPGRLQDDAVLGRSSGATRRS